MRDTNTRRIMVIAALFLFSSPVMAGNFATCILDRMPGVQNNPVAFAILRICKEKYPGGLDSVILGEGRGWFGFDSGAECSAKKAAKTPNQRAAAIIATACRRLYDKGPFDDLLKQ